MKKINASLLALPLYATLAKILGESEIGKVRHTYTLPDHPDKLLVVATDRISIFDFVLKAQVMFKGAVLTAMTIHWLKNVFADLPNHLVAYGVGIDEYLPEKLRGNPDLQVRAIIVKKLMMLPVECVIRGNLMGSGWKSYQNDGTVCGIKLPDGLVAGSELPRPILTPTTKSNTGHDAAITFEEMIEILEGWIKENGLNEDAQLLAGKVRELSLELFIRGRDYGKEHKVRVLDTKFELGLDENGTLTVGDEVLTPDSSRFTKEDEYLAAMAAGKEPKTSDKQYVRNEGAKIETPFTGEDSKPIVGLNNLEPENEEHVDWVAELEWPDDVLDKTTAIYLEVCAALVGSDLVDFQAETMNIAG